MPTFQLKTGERVQKWFVLDLKGVALGRAATVIARILRGKHLPTFTPHIDGGDFVICVNAAEVALTGAKETDKPYYDHSGYFGGLKTRTAAAVRAKHPDELIRRAVKGMMPRSALAHRQLKKLKVYAGAEHPHAAQTPETLNLADWT